MTNKKIEQIIFKALDDVNSYLPIEQRLTLSPNTKLTDGILDSLGLINLIVSIEQAISEEFFVLISLSDQNAINAEHNPFETVEILTEYICNLLDATLVTEQ